MPPRLIARLLFVLVALVGSCHDTVAQDKAVAQDGVDLATGNALSVEFLSAKSAGNVLAGGDDDEFFSRLYPREAAAMTGSPRGKKTRQESQQYARDFFRNAALDFAEDEKAALRLLVHRLKTLFAKDYETLIVRPWKFVKTRDDLCAGFSFTRSDCIVLSEKTLRKIVQVTQKQEPKTAFAEGLLLHEQMHVLQRAEPERFVSLYEDVFRFRAANVLLDPWIDERQVTNPDAVGDDWVAEIPSADGGSQYFWIGTILEVEKPLHRMGRDFSMVAVRLKQTEAGYEMLVRDGKPDYLRTNELEAFTGRLPVASGYDHPNEVAAYLFTAITHDTGRVPVKGAALEVFEEAKRWFKLHLKDGEGPNQKPAND